jgi:uncharacterized protein (TIGR03000 family)
MSNQPSFLRFAILLSALFFVFPAETSAQFRGHPGPIGPPPAPFQRMPGPFLNAPAARQSALPLMAPPVSPLLNRPFPMWGMFGGYSYFPFDSEYYYYSQPNIFINYNYPYPFPYAQPYLPPRFFTVLPPAPNPHPNSALLTLTVPAGAEVFVGGKKTDMSGTTRTFESPDLKPGETYTFDVRVTWKENSKNVEEKRTIDMKAGEHQSLQYVALPPAPVRLEK